MKPVRRKPQRRRAARSQEGAVLLIVLLMVMMATGSALYAMQATFYEQGASTSYAEAAWTRSLAEGAVMSGLAVIESGEIQRASLVQNLDLRWRVGALPRSPFAIKYGMPTPLQGLAAPPTNADSARSFDNSEDNNAFLTSMQEGLLGFCLPNHDNQAPYGLPQRLTLNTRSIRTPACRGIYETWGGLGSGTTTTAASVGSPVRPRTRHVITGIGETSVPNDPMDSGGQRALHETVGMARAYFDRLN